MIFLERLSDLIKSKGITKNKLLLELGLNKSSFFDWERRGTTPNGEALSKIADYFNVSTDYLLGRTEEKSPSTTERMFFMTEKQRLVYDLSLQCATIEVQRNGSGKINLGGELLDAFTGYIMRFQAMDDSALQAPLDELKKI